MGKKKSIIKRFFNKLIFFIILIAILLFVYGKYGMGWQGLNSFVSSVYSKHKNLEKNKPDEQNKELNKKNEIIKVKLNMVFIDDLCYVGIYKCSNAEQLKKAIIKIQKDNFEKDIEIIYKEKSDDNYLLAKKYRNILKNSGFGFKLEKCESNEKQRSPTT